MSIKNAIQHLKARNFTEHQLNMAIKALEEQLYMPNTINIDDLNKVSGIGDKTIERVKKTLSKNDRSTNISYKRSFDLPLNNLYVGESVRWMQNNMPSNFVDLTVTSPPYDDLRTYNGYLFDYRYMLEELYRVTKDGGVVVWVIGDKTQNGSETGTSFKHALYAKKIGFNLHDTMIYAKNNVYAHDPRNKRYKQCFEYMFVFSKGKPNTYNEIKDRPNKHAGKTLTGTKGRTKYGEKRDLKPVIMNDFQARFNIWEYTTGGNVSKDKIAFEHPAIFPEQLVNDHILSWSNKGDIVFDPMCGAGTTCKMAYLNNREFIGVDISEEYINNICIPRLQEYNW